MLTNILENANTYSYQNSTVSLEVKYVPYAIQDKYQGTIQVSIKDFGRGMSRETRTHLKKLLGKRYLSTMKVDRASALLISKLIVDRLDGKISFETEEGQGSRFTFDFKVFSVK